MVDVDSIINAALAAERARVDAARLEGVALLSKLTAQRDELTANNIVKVSAQVAAAEADLALIDAAAALK